MAPTDKTKSLEGGHPPSGLSSSTSITKLLPRQYPQQYPQQSPQQLPQQHDKTVQATDKTIQSNENTAQSNDQTDKMLEQLQVFGEDDFTVAFLFCLFALIVVLIGSFLFLSLSWLVAGAAVFAGFVVVSRAQYSSQLPIILWVCLQSSLLTNK